MQKIIQEIRNLLEEKKVKQAKELYEENKFELDKYFEAQKFQSIKWHEYTWYNKLFLTLFNEPWKYWTFKQWKEEWYKVKKWARWNQIFVPIFSDKEENKIRFMKSVFVFHENQVEKYNPEQD